jgi:hypothetical protein
MYDVFQNSVCFFLDAIVTMTTTDRPMDVIIDLVGTALIWKSIIDMWEMFFDPPMSIYIGSVLGLLILFRKNFFGTRELFRPITPMTVVSRKVSVT